MVQANPDQDDHRASDDVAIGVAGTPRERMRSQPRFAALAGVRASSLKVEA